MKVFRNPTSKPYFFYKVLDDKIVFANNIKLIIDYLGNKQKFSLDYFYSYISKSFIDSKQTPFVDIFELPLATKISFQNNQVKEEKKVWNPYKFTDNNISFNEFENKLIDLTTNVVTSYSQSSDKIVLDFSGGFDSTSLLYFLKNNSSDKEILALNFYDKDVRSSNELTYARKISQSLGIKLEELELSSLLPFSECVYNEKIYPNWPTSNMIYYKKLLYIYEKYINFDKNVNVTYLSGHGGDNIFMCPPFKESITDYFIDNGFSGLFGKIQQFSLLERDPFFSITLPVLKNYINYILNKNYFVTQKFEKVKWLANESNNFNMVTESEYKKSRITPGKKELLDSIMIGLCTIKCNLIHHNTTALYPFFSQKLIELCLSFPVYDSFKHGYNRYHARSSISKHFNTNFVWRKDKGETSGVLQKGIIQNYKNIQELCMEGVCAQNNMLDREALYLSLKSLKNGICDDQWPVSSLITLEIFCKMWHDYV